MRGEVPQPSHRWIPLKSEQKNGGKPSCLPHGRRADGDLGKMECHDEFGHADAALRSRRPSVSLSERKWWQEARNTPRVRSGTTAIPS
jgi:hypothetical protein